MMVKMPNINADEHTYLLIIMLATVLDVFKNHPSNTECVKCTC